MGRSETQFGLARHDQRVDKRSGSTRALPGVTGVVLAGGAATRMGGRPKGLLERAPGLTLIRYLIDELTNTGVVRVVLSANDPQRYGTFGVPVVSDRHPGRGPLAGIDAALAHVATTPDTDAALFVPCDTPGISHKELSQLLHAFQRSPSGLAMAVTGETPPRVHPLCCVVHERLLPRITTALNEGELSVRRLWKDLDAMPVTFDSQGSFANINTPVEWRGWQQDNDRMLDASRNNTDGGKRRIWVISGACRKVGKTWLAERLAAALPEAVYAKIGHGLRREDKPTNYFTDLDAFAAFLDGLPAQVRNVVAESNKLALERKGDIRIYLDAPAAAADVRADAPELKAAAHLVIGGESAPGDWAQALRGLDTPETETRIHALLSEQHRFLLGQGHLKTEH